MRRSVTAPNLWRFRGNSHQHSSALFHQILVVGSERLSKRLSKKIHLDWKNDVRGFPSERLPLCTIKTLEGLQIVHLDMVASCRLFTVDIRVTHQYHRSPSSFLAHGRRVHIPCNPNAVEEHGSYETDETSVGCSGEDSDRKGSDSDALQAVGR